MYSVQSVLSFLSVSMMSFSIHVQNSTKNERDMCYLLLADTCWPFFCIKDVAMLNKQLVHKSSSLMMTGCY
jgi:hypothetical protein